MYFLPIALIFVTTLSLIITYFSITIKKTSMEMVNAMGIGLNLANTFDCFQSGREIKTPMEQITLYGNNIPTKKMITNIKKNGIKTIRLPITWIYFIDEAGNIDSEWISIIKKVVKMIIKEKMYCILNLYHDTDKGNWLGEGTNSKDKYVNLWKNIANEFKNYNDYLVFESMDDIEYSYDSDFMNIYELNNAFVQAVRNSGGKNGDRLLILAGANKNLNLICSPEYKIPIDPSKRFAISIHYYLPEQFAIEPDDNPWTWNDNGVEKIVQPITVWGDENDYKDMFTNFESMKQVFLDKETFLYNFKDSIKQICYDFFSSRINNFNNEEKIGENMKSISKKKFVNPNDYFILTNKETVSTTTRDDTLIIKFGKKKLMTIIFNAYINIDNKAGVGFGVTSSDSSGNWIGNGISGNEGEKKYDGSYTITVDVKNQDYSNQVEIQKWWGNDHIILNYLTLEFEEKYIFFDYNSYIKNFS